jgi:PAS domain S-box-containing protein
MPAHALELLLQGSPLRTILESAMDAIIMVDEEQTILFFNAAAESIFGYSRSQIIGEPLSRLMPERFRAGHAMHVAAFRDSNASTARSMGQDRVVSALRRNGEEFPISASISSAAVSGHRLYTVILRDIAVQVRTREALERSNRDLQQFAFIASHDLKTPLRAIAGFVELLEKEYAAKLDDNARDYIRRTSAAAHRLERLIDDLLSFARQSSTPVSRVPVNCNLVYEDAVRLLEEAIRESGARVTAGELPVINGVAAQLTQLLQNLISNAIKYQGDKPPQIHVSAARQGAEWLFSVADNGIGIDPRHHVEVFEIFRRLHTHSPHEGTGIGLALCRQIVQGHGGRIWVASEPGKGSVFQFSLPGGA